MTTVCVDPSDFTTDGAGRLQIRTACGIENGDDGIMAAVVDWPFDPACAETQGEAIYCSPVTGKLVTRPRPHLDCVTVVQTQTEDVVLDGVGELFTLTAEANIDTTEWCGTDQVCVDLNVGGSWDIQHPESTVWRIDVQESLDGAAFTNLFFGVAGVGTFTDGASAIAQGHFYGRRVFNVSGGTVLNYRTRMLFTNGRAPGITVRAATARIAGTFQTSNP